MVLRVTCVSAEQTKLFARKLGEKLRGGEIIQLIGDVGAGKTTFTSGLVEGLGSEDLVSSPTFTICNRYQGDHTIYHCDFYRLSDDKLIENELDDLIDGESILVLEWAENISSLKPEDHLAIRIESADENTRVFEMKIPAKYGYINK